MFHDMSGSGSGLLNFRILILLIAVAIFLGGLTSCRTGLVDCGVLLQKISAERSATQVVEMGAPSWPDGSTLSTYGVGLTNLTLNWTHAAEVVTYRIYQGETLFATVDGTIDTYNATGLTANTSFTFYVEACNDAGNCSSIPSKLFVRTLTPVEATERIFDEIMNFVDTGAMSEDKGTSLITTLGGVLQNLYHGNIAEATTRLQAFILKVNRMRDSGELKPEIGSGLINEANDIVAQLRE